MTDSLRPEELDAKGNKSNKRMEVTPEDGRIDCIVERMFFINDTIDELIVVTFLSFQLMLIYGGIHS